MSKPKQIPIVDANQKQMLAFAKIFGLEYQGQPSADTLRELVFEAGYGRDTIPDLTAVAPDRPSSLPSRTSDVPIVWNVMGRACFPIMLTTKEGKGGDKPVPVPVNGVNTLVPRGKPVPLPIPLVFSLGDAVQDIPETDRDGKIVAWTKVPSYPFQFVSPDDLNPDDLAPPDFEPDPSALAEAERIIADRKASKKKLAAA